MAGSSIRKRPGGDLSKQKAGRFNKRQKKQMAYHSDSESEEENDGPNDFQAVNLLDSDDDLENAVVDDGASTASENSAEDSSDSLDDLPSETAPRKKRRVAAKDTAGDLSEIDFDSDSDDAANSTDSEGGASNKAGPQSKRNDPTMFSTSLHKILGTKLSSTRRSDPVLARSAEAREASRRVVDAALEEKARKQMRLERRAAFEKGRVKDVLIASNNTNVAGAGGDAGGDDGDTTASIMASERRLRKFAQRGVVQLFNAVRAAKVTAAEAEKKAKRDGLLGMDKRGAKVTEMSRKGFLDLIASGGGEAKNGSA